jgi:hypothetical protein
VSGATCATCRFFVPYGLNVGFCHRNPPREGDKDIEDAARMWCGEHAPTPAVGVPGLPSPWRFQTGATGRAYVDNPTTHGWCFVDEGGLVSSYDAPPDVIAVVLEAHRARAGGAA